MGDRDRETLEENERLRRSVEKYESSHVSVLRLDLRSLLERLEAAEASGREYIQRTDPMLFCSGDLTCGTCRGCLKDENERLRTALEAIAGGDMSVPEHWREFARKALNGEGKP